MENSTNDNAQKKGLNALRSKPWFLPTVLGLIFLGLAFGTWWWWQNSSRIYIEKSEISAPLIELASQGAGTLNGVFVQPGDRVLANAGVARVGNELIKTKVAGEIVSVKNDIGKILNRGEAPVVMIDSKELRVIGRIEETKGLKDIKVGQKVIFTVDAFGAQEFYGVVDEVSPTSRESGIAFNISDKREVKEFEIKARFNIEQYPELKNGMSAKMWVYKK